jgi:two-component system chemotaxis response regulator CheB
MVADGFRRGREDRLMRPVRLAIVDDSSFVRKALVRIMEGEPAIRVVGAAASGEELLANIGKWRPEVVTLDLSMPGMGGLATLDRIGAWRDIPVIILSTHSSKDAPLTIEALHRGATDFIDKQEYSLIDFGGLRDVLVRKILGVTGRGPAPQMQPEAVLTPPQPEPLLPLRTEAQEGNEFSAVLIGASTGGPPALQRILEQLETPFPAPIVIVQHMPSGFTEAFAKRLDGILPFRVCEPEHGEILEQGTVYIAPADYHLVLENDGDDLVAVRRKRPDHLGHRPSVDVLFQSAAALARQGCRFLAALLTGMGRDGAQGLAELASAGAYTITQNESTCVVYGMPKAAQELGAACEVLPLPAIATRINQLIGSCRGTSAVDAVFQSNGEVSP